MIEDGSVVYEVYLRSQSARDKKSDLGYYAPVKQTWIQPEDVDAWKKSFLEAKDKISKENKSFKEYNKYCYEYELNGKVHLEYLMGFVALDQSKKKRVSA